MNETLADILAEMREYDNTPPPKRAWLDIADRIEAAAEREKVEAVTIAATKAINLTDEKWRRDTSNAATMRAALEKWIDIPLPEQRYNMSSDGFVEVADDESRWLTYLRKMLKELRAALDAPARNCDVGTAEEQWDRFTKFCGTHLFCSNCPVKPLWNFEKGRKPSCGLLWAQMPYEAEGGAE